MNEDSLQALVRRGLTALEEGNTVMALVHFEKAAEKEPTPLVLSCLGYCLAREKGDLQRAASLCLEAMKQEPRNSLHHLNLGRIYLVAGQKTRAIQTFRKGLKLERNPKIIDELRQLGLRRSPLFPSRDRDHFLNKYLGLFLNRLGLR